MKKGILIANLGTPNSPSVRDVRRFLREFLMDPLVLDIPDIPRWLLVNCIIVPFRGPKSAKEYQRLWTDEGSPLKVHSEALLGKIQIRNKDKYELALSMRYQEPDIRQGLEKLKQAGCEQLLIFPLFPQYAEATTLSTLHKVTEELENMQWKVTTRHINSFATDEGYIGALVERSNMLAGFESDHTVFSFHGLPERQLQKLNENCFKDDCCQQLTENNSNCYRAQCFATSRAVAKRLGLSQSQYTVCFQSRQGKLPWIQPYTDEVIEQLAKQGYQKLRVFSPAFVADCLETTVEIGHTYRQLFLEMGGQDLQLVAGLNSADSWVDAVENMINREVEKAFDSEV